jgi:hypothetical protein
MTVATCDLCPPGHRDVPDDEMPEHLRTVHPPDAHRLDVDGSTIVQDSSLEPDVDHGPGDQEWRR